MAHLLIVDDDASTLASLSRAFRLAGHTATVCDNAARALQNLVLNAMDAMPGGGTLRILTRQYNGTVILEISDTGQGLTAEECGRLFTPYYTTKRHGTGLGLAIVQSVVSDHHGTISVESAPGRGTMFRIELPVNQARAARD